MHILIINRSVMLCMQHKCFNERSARFSSISEHAIEIKGNINHDNHNITKFIVE